MSTWRMLYLAEHYGRMTLTLDEVAQQIGLARRARLIACLAS